MKRFLFFLIIFFLFIYLTIFNEEYATTDKGKKVILHNNGTWEYYVEKKLENKEVKKEEVQKEYTKSENLKSELKGSRKAYTIWYDESKWTSSKLKSNDKNIEYKFSNKNNNSEATMIYEKTSIPIDTLKELILFNAKNDGVNVQLLNSEYRNVNNNNLLLIKYSIIIQGYSHVYYGYIFSNKNGSYQFFTKIEASSFNEIKNDMEELINGIVIN